MFFGIRYGTLITQIATIAVDIQSGTLAACKAVVWTTYLVVPLVNIMLAAFGSLRVWAIWGRHWMPLIVLLPISLIPVIGDLYLTASSSIYTSPLPPPVGGCFAVSSLPADIQRRFGISSQVSDIASGTIILIATWIKTWSIRQTMKAADGAHVSLSELLIRDGTLYYIVIQCLTITALALEMTPYLVWNMPAQAAPSVTAILISRLILNLRSYNRDAESENNRRLSSVNFANVFLGNIGASVSVDGQNDSDSDAEYNSNRQVNSTVDEIVNNPLAIGLRADILHMRPSIFTNDDDISVPSDKGENTTFEAI